MMPLAAISLGRQEFNVQRQGLEIDGREVRAPRLFASREG